jgi:hypothetical protein
MKRIRMAVAGVGLSWLALSLIGCNNQSSTTTQENDSTAATVEQTTETEMAPALTIDDLNTDDSNIFTVVYATSDDGFVNVRETPSAKAAIIDTLWMMFHGLGNGVLVEDQEGWSKVSVHNHVGWVNNHYIDYQRWYDGTGDSILVAAKDPTPLYGENYADEGDYPLFTTVKKGTILADDFIIHQGYYNLITGHDYIFIKLEDAVIVEK